MKTFQKIQILIIILIYETFVTATCTIFIVALLAQVVNPPEKNSIYKFQKIALR